MENKLKELKEKFLQEIHAVKALGDLESLEVKYLGRKGGELTSVLRGIKDVSQSDRPRIGDLANQVKKEIENAIARSRSEFHGTGGGEDAIDVTLPGTSQPEGHLHIVTQAIHEIETIFSRIGFGRVRIPEVEWDYYAFEALNMPQGHPARDEWETFFIEGENGRMQEGAGKWGKMILTPHTSSGQVREMEKKILPIRMISIGKCYRRQIDVSHTPMFHQFEGVFIDKNVTISHLKGVLDYFAKEFFGPQRKTRIRPFHFQFTEPSFEVDVTCGVCNGVGCKLCKEGWLELGGSGMIHPNVLKAGGVDPRKYSGFAFGWGVERVYMMKPGLKLPDIRLLYQNDLRFLEQF